MIRRLLTRLFATRTVRVEKPVPWVLWDDDELRADGMSERDIELLREGIVRVPSPDEAVIRQVWDQTRPTPEDQAIIDRIRATPLPEVTPDMRQRAIAKFEAEFPPAPERPATLADTKPLRRPVLSADRAQAARDRVFGEQLGAERRIVEQPSGRWPGLPRDHDLSRSRWEPPQPSDYQPTTPPPAPLPRGTAGGPGFARTLERIDDVIAQEAAAKRLYDGLGDPA